MGDNPDTAPPALLVVAGAKDKTILAWATRLLHLVVRLRGCDSEVVPDSGHLLLHNHLDVSVPAIRDWLDRKQRWYYTCHT